MRYPQFISRTAWAYTEIYYICEIEKVLCLQLSSYGYKYHVTAKCSMARAQLRKIMQFRQLEVGNELRLYHALVSSQLICPPIPFHTTHRSRNVKNTSCTYHLRCSA